MRRARVLCLVVFAAVICTIGTSCASALKRQCEATNWFEYGESVAKSGRRTGDDTFVKQCEQEEVDVDHAALARGFQQGYAQYCTPEASFLLGKRGEFLSPNLCDGTAQERSIKARHAEGVREYCQPANGLPSGASGRKYNQICPKDLEPAFLVKFNEGRKKYLGVVIADSKERVQSLDREIVDLASRKGPLQKELNILLLARPVIAIRNASASGKDGKPKEVDPVQREWERQCADLRRQINGLESEIRGKRAEQEQLRNSIRDAKTELAGL